MSRDLRLVIPYLKKYKGELLHGVVTLVVSSLFAAAIPYLIKYAVDGLQAGLLTRVGGLIALTAVFALIQAALRYHSRMKILNSSREIEYELRQDVYQRLVSLPYGFFRDHHRGDLIARMMNDVNNVRMMVGLGILHFSSTIATTALSFGMMLKLSPLITAASIVPLCLLFLAIRRYMGKLFHIFKDVQDSYGNLSKGVTEVLSGIRVIKNYLLEKREQERFDGLNRDYMAKNMAATKVWGLVFPSIGFLGGIGTLIVMWLGGYFLMMKRITLGDFIALNTYFMMLMWPIAALGWILNLYQRGIASLKRIETIMDQAPEPDTGRDSGVKPVLALDRVFLTKGGRSILSDVSLVLRPGEKLLVAGPTGSGKSTIFNVILGLEGEYGGTVLLDGRDIREIGLAARRGRIAMVPQEPFLYSWSIRRNLFSDQNIDELIAAVSMSKEIERMEKGLETVVGERGVTLSGGQKQRLTLARALAARPDILLMDDPFTHVDGYTEHMIWQRIWPLIQDATVIIASSRPVPTMYVDRAVVLGGDGRIVDEGSIAELVARDPYLKLLYAEAERA